MASYHSEIVEINPESQPTPPVDASSSASTSTFIASDLNNNNSSNYEYDIFINHRGPDVKKTFASHLYRRLHSYGLRAFLDFQELHEGENFSSQIKRAIASASVHVAIFSLRYAESNWCLEELRLMIESKASIIPVFYHVKPSVLRWTLGKDGRGVYAQALHNLENKKTYEDKPRYDSDTIESWRNAIFSVAEISGFELEACNDDEGELVDKVVECVLKKLKRTRLHVARYPTGLDEKVKDFENTILLHGLQIGKPKVIGIVGLGGVGKTTLAKELFNRKISYYQRYCFLSDVRENAGKGSLPILQMQLLESLGNNFLDHVGSVDQGKEILSKRLPSYDMLVILDDVDHEDQLDALLPMDSLHKDSLVLITSRDKSLLRRSGVKESAIYRLTGLNAQDSRDLFCLHAFSQPSPFPGFEDLVDKFLKACGGLPLSLKVFGGLLYGNNEKSYWEDQLDKLQSILPTKIKQRLQISYDSLDRQEQHIFLDIACFFVGENKDTAIRIWNGSGWKGSLGFQNLQNKCLAEVDAKNCISMHDHLKDLARDVVQDSGLQRCLLTTRESMNIDYLLKQHSFVITKVRGIRMLPSAYKGNDDFNYYESLPSEMPWVKRRIHELFLNRVTKLPGTPAISNTELQLIYTEDRVLKRILRRMHLPNLICLSWLKCPYSSLPSWIPMENLRVLHVDGSELKTLWHGKLQVPFQLRELAITGPLSKIPKSIGKLKHLEEIHVSFASGDIMIETLPKEFCNLLSLKRLELLGASRIKSLPDAFGSLRNLERIELSRACNLERLPNSFGNLTRLKYLALTEASKIKSLQDSFRNLRNLEHINLSGARSLKELPNYLENLIRLKHLNLYGCHNLTISSGILAKIRTLQFLNLSLAHRSQLESSLILPQSLEELYLDIYMSPEFMPFQVAGNLSNLEQLELNVGGLCVDMLLPLLRDLRNLKALKLLYCYNLNSLPDSLGTLSKLAKLELECCGDLAEVTRLPSTLITLKLSECDDLREIKGLCGLTQLQTLEISRCKKVEELPSMETLVSLEELRAHQCVKLNRILGLAQLTKLRIVSVSRCRELKELAGIERVRSLEILDASRCSELLWDERVLEQLSQRLKEGGLVI